MFDSDKIVIFRSKDSLMIKYVDYNEGIYNDDKSILYMISKNDSKESFEFMVQKSNDELIDFVKNLYNDDVIQDLDKKLSGEIPVTREELITLVSSWGRKESFITNDKIQIFKSEPNKCYDLSNLDVSQIDDFDNIFESSYYNGDLSNWKTSNVESMSGTFKNSNFNNDSLKDWDVSNISNYMHCFLKSEFNGNLSNWKMNKANNLYEMFAYSEFNNDSLNNWYMKNVKDIYGMFQGGNFCGDISNWEIDVFEINATCIFADNKNFKEKYGNIYSNNDFLKWLSERKIENKNLESNIIEYIDIKSEKYNKLNIDGKIKVLNDNLDILNKNVDDNNKLLQTTKTTYSKDESIDPNTKKLIFAEFEKRCKESNSIINDSISKNQDELEKQIVKKSLFDTNIDFDIFK